MTKMFEGKGKTIEDAFMVMLESLKESEAFYKVQVHDGDWVIGIKAENLPIGTRRTNGRTTARCFIESK